MYSLSWRVWNTFEQPYQVKQIVDADEQLSSLTQWKHNSFLIKAKIWFVADFIISGNPQVDMRWWDWERLWMRWWRKLESMMILLNLLAQRRFVNIPIAANYCYENKLSMCDIYMDNSFNHVTMSKEQQKGFMVQL